MKHLKIGDPLPAFKGIDQSNTEISSDNYKGKKLVIYFYPKDNTPGCTAQACNLQENIDKLKENDIELVGISADTVSSHQKFTEKYNLEFPLIADTDKKIIDSFGVWGEKKFMGKIYDGIHRTTFLVDEDQKIVGIIEKPKTKAHSEEILELFKNI